MYGDQEKSSLHVKASYASKYRKLKDDNTANRKQILEEIQNAEKNHDFLQFDKKLQEGPERYEVDQRRVDRKRERDMKVLRMKN
jgi:hypothetical protein